MRVNIKVRLIAFLLLLCWMMAIFIMSAQPANESSRVSGGFVQKIIDVIYSDFESFSTSRQASIANNLTFIIRKTAHFLEYFILGALSVIIAFTFEKGSTFVKALGATLFSVIYAVSDEIHQYFVPGRACRFFDISIDSLGCVCAVVLIAIAIGAVKRRKSGELNAEEKIN